MVVGGIGVGEVDMGLGVDGIGLGGVVVHNMVDRDDIGGHRHWFRSKVVSSGVQHGHAPHTLGIDVPHTLHPHDDPQVDVVLGGGRLPLPLCASEEVLHGRRCHLSPRTRMVSV